MSETLEIRPGDRLLVSRTDRLGDLILALPLVESLKARYPECRVDVMASLYASPILEHNPRIDGIVRVQNDQLIASRYYRQDLEQKVRRGGYKAVVVLYPERRISRLLYRAGLPNRLGTAGRFHSVYFTHRLLHSRKSNRKHESEYNLDFLTYFKDGETVTRPIVHPTPREVRNAQRLLGNAGGRCPFIVVHPGSGGSAEQWPIERFLELCRDLGKSGHQVIVTGSESEREALGRKSAELGIELKSLAGQTDLRTLAALLSLATAVVANSTGPLHLATAVGTRVVGIYPSKKVMSPVRWGPLGEGHRVIQPSTRNCRCPDGACRCMETITVVMVAQAVQRIYDNAADK